MKKILVIQTAFIGDVILATAVIEKLHRFFPDAEIDFLVRKSNASLLQNHPFLHAVLTWDKKKNKYASLIRVWREIRCRRYDHVINLHRFFSSGWLTAFSAAKETCGFDKNPLSFLFSKKVPHVITTQTPFEHEVQRCLHLIDHLTGQTFQMPRLYPSPEDEEKILPLVKERFITISPASVWFTKQLPVHEWAELTKHLTDVKIFLLGAPADVPLCEKLVRLSNHPNIEIAAGKLSLLQSAALMKKAQMNYTNDSAPMHLCSAMDAPVTAVFCSTIPAFGFGPLSTHSFIVETHEKLTCRPCGLHGYNACPQGHFRCSKINREDLLRWRTPKN